MSDTIEIALSGKYGVDKVFLIDSDDIEKINTGRKWSCSKVGYAFCDTRNYARTEGKLVYMHHLIVDVPKGMVVDHINGNKLDNRKSNLRICNQRQNTWNKRKRSNNKSGYTGVSWNKAASKWSAEVRKDGEKHYLGLYVSKHAAAKAYNRKAKELFGEFTRLNEIKEGVND